LLFWALPNATLCGGQGFSGFSLIAQNERHE